MTSYVYILYHNYINVNCFFHEKAKKIKGLRASGMCYDRGTEAENNVKTQKWQEC